MYTYTINFRNVYESDRKFVVHTKQLGFSILPVVGMETSESVNYCKKRLHKLAH